MTSYPSAIRIHALRISNEKDKLLPAFDHTALSAINTCPTWGIIRYMNHKSLSDGRRPIPLEFGAACHHAFAAVRLFQLAFHQRMKRHAIAHGQRIFGGDWPMVWDAMNEKESVQQRLRNAAMVAFHTSKFEDDPYDRRRTVDAAEIALYHYIDQWDMQHPVWIANKKKPEAPIGVELLVDFTVDLELPADVLRQSFVPAANVVSIRKDKAIVSVRYVGRMDGLHYHGERLYIHENKTSASKLGDAWRESYSISHQITGYTIAASLYAKEHVGDAYAIGLQIPLPKDMFEAVVYHPVYRDTHNYARWVTWLWHSVNVAWQYEGDALNAPKYSHSCNRYFRPCSFIPLCYAEEEEQREMFAGMVDDKWSPLREYEMKVGE